LDKEASVVSEWKMRQEIPDGQVRDAAEQFMSAWKLLEKQPRSGILLPLINTAAVAIELYLKCLSSEVIYTPDDQMDGWHTVTAKPQRFGHTLGEILNKIPRHHQLEIQQTYADKHANDSRTFEDVLGSLEGAFMESRYTFEKNRNVARYSLNDLKNVCELLSKYVTDIKYKETIHWSIGDTPNQT
jgi:hypothetical protein